MRYSIYSRFRATLFGVAIGEIWGQSNGKQNLHYLKTETNLSPTPILDVVKIGMKTLIEQGRFNPEAGYYSWVQQHLSPSEAILATLPVALFYHENELKLRQNLQLALVVMERDEPESRDGALALGYAIATALQAKASPIELVARTIAFVGETQTAMVAKLAQVRALLEQRVGLETAFAALGEPDRLSSQIAFALFCCLSTPSDFRLAIERAAKHKFAPQLASAIAGALSGASNGMVGIPATMSFSVAQVTNRTEMLRLCDALVAVWSGMYEQSNRAAFNQIAAIAAPQIVRRR